MTDAASDPSVDVAQPSPSEAPSPEAPSSEAASSEAPHHVNVTALFAEAASKSSLLWVEVPGDRAWPFWHAWANETVYAVSGPGEQALPWMPDEVVLVARSKDTGGRLLTVHATARTIEPGSEEWQRATEALKAARLNAIDDLDARWAAECTVRAFHPFGAPLEEPGSYATTSGARPVPPSEATTAGWRPWHWRGRPLRRRGNRLPDEG